MKNYIWFKLRLQNRISHVPVLSLICSYNIQVSAFFLSFKIWVSLKMLCMWLKNPPSSSGLPQMPPFSEGVCLESAQLLLWCIRILDFKNCPKPWDFFPKFSTSLGYWTISRTSVIFSNTNQKKSHFFLCSPMP